MAELNMHPTRSFVRMNATYTNRIPSGGVSYAPSAILFSSKKYIVYGQGPIACLYPRYEVYRGYIVFAFSVIMFVCLFVCKLFSPSKISQQLLGIGF